MARRRRDVYQSEGVSARRRRDAVEYQYPYLEAMVSHLSQKQARLAVTNGLAVRHESEGKATINFLAHM